MTDYPTQFGVYTLAKNFCTTCANWNWKNSKARALPSKCLTCKCFKHFNSQSNWEPDPELGLVLYLREER